MFGKRESTQRFAKQIHATDSTDFHILLKQFKMNAEQNQFGSREIWHNCKTY